MILNDIMAVILPFLPRKVAFGAKYVKRPIVPATVM